MSEWQNVLPRQTSVSAYHPKVGLHWSFVYWGGAGMTGWNWAGRWRGYASCLTCNWDNWSMGIVMPPPKHCMIKSCSGRFCSDGNEGRFAPRKPRRSLPVRRPLKDSEVPRERCPATEPGDIVGGQERTPLDVNTVAVVDGPAETCCVGPEM